MAALRFFNPLPSVWISHETLCLVFNLLQHFVKYTEKDIHLPCTFHNLWVLHVHQNQVEHYPAWDHDIWHLNKANYRHWFIFSSRGFSKIDRSLQKSLKKSFSKSLNLLWNKAHSKKTNAFHWLFVLMESHDCEL